MLRRREARRPPTQPQAAKWKDASISALSIPIDEDTPITWKEWCLTEGNRLGKTLLEIRDKYLEGFPASFDVVILAEKNSAANGGNGNFVRPANYAVYYPLALADTGRPLLERWVCMDREPKSGGRAGKTL